MNLSPAQLHAVRAIALKGDASVHAWEAWKAATGGRPADTASVQLIPMLYAALRQQSVRDSTLDALRPAYVRAWRTNLSLLKQLPSVVGVLKAHGIDAIALKGTALLSLYGDDGARVLADLDLLVPERRFAQAWKEMESAGWRPARDGYRVPDTRFNNAVNLVGPEGVKVDLHCHVLQEDCAEGADDGFWTRSTPATIHGSLLRTLSLPDSLLMVLAHGTRGRSEVPHLRWIIDAAKIVEGGISWPQFVASAREHGIARVMHDALLDLREWIGLSVPESTMGELRAAPSDLLAVVIHRYGDLGHVGLPASRLQFHWAALSRGVGSTSVVRRLAAIPAYLRYWCQVDREWQVPGALLIKLLRMVGFRLGIYRYPNLPRAAG